MRFRLRTLLYLLFASAVLAFGLFLGVMDWIGVAMLVAMLWGAGRLLGAL